MGNCGESSEWRNGGKVRSHGIKEGEGDTRSGAGCGEVGQATNTDPLWCLVAPGKREQAGVHGTDSKTGVREGHCFVFFPTENTWHS